MKTKKRRCKSVSIPSSRWAAYATAGAATALGGIYSAEGSIHYSGILNLAINAPPGSTFISYIQLAGQAAGNSLVPLHARSASGSGVAIFYMAGAVSARIAGFQAGAFPYASRLNFGQGINSRPFIGTGTFAKGTLAFRGGYTNSQWLSSGIGYLGFRFDSGSGMQFGWVQIRMDKGAPGNSYTIIDYAYGDVGDMISAGQVPEPGSLGLLALGGLGLVAWRRKRGQAAVARQS